jgi:hypothetical protein
MGLWDELLTQPRRHKSSKDLEFKGLSELRVGRRYPAQHRDREIALLAVLPSKATERATTALRQQQPTRDRVRATHLMFRGWTATTAFATGIYVENNCKPICLGGQLIDYAATFVFSSPQRGFFSRVHVTFVDHRGPRGSSHLDRYL